MKKIITFLLLIAIILSLTACSNKADNDKVSPYDAPVVIIAKNMKNFINDYRTGDITIVDSTNTDGLDTEEDPGYAQNIITREGENQLYIDNFDNVLFLSTENHTLSYDPNTGFQVVQDSETNFVENILYPFVQVMDWVISSPDKFDYNKTELEDYNIYSILISDIKYFANKYNAEIGATDFNDIKHMAIHFYTVEDSTKLDFIEWSMEYEEGIYSILTYLFDSASVGYNEIGNNVEYVWDYAHQTIEDYKNANVMTGNQ